MRVLFYTDTPGHGGAERQMELLAKYLSQSGVTVHLAYGGYSQLEQSKFAPFCEAIYALPTLHKHDPRHYQRLKEILRHGQYDLIHIHLWNPGACRYAFLAAAHVGVPIVTTEHDPFELKGIKRLIKMRCLKNTRHTIVISRDNFRLMREIYGQAEDRLSVIHNGITVERFIDKEGADGHPRLLERMGILAGDTLITCIAELHARKGHRYLFQAFKALELSVPRLQLLIVGKGPLEREFHEKYGEHPNIHFLGWREDIPVLLKITDIFILPSLNEAFGLVLLEAMASGVAVIGTNAGGVPDIIEDGRSGLLVPPANSEALKEAIFTLLRNPDFKRDLEQAARQRVCQFFTAERMAEETMQVYQSVIRNK